MTVSERMFYILDKKQLKSVDLSKVLGVGTGQISTWKKRNTDPPAKYISQICEFLGVSFEYLLTGKESQTTDDTECAPIVHQLSTEKPHLFQAETIKDDKINDDPQAVTAFIHIKLGNDWDNFPHSINRIPHKGDTVSFYKEGPVYEVDETLFNYFECTYEVEIFVHQIRP